MSSYHFSIKLAPFFSYTRLTPNEDLHTEVKKVANRFLSSQFYYTKAAQTAIINTNYSARLKSASPKQVNRNMRHFIDAAMRHSALLVGISLWG